MTTKLDQLLESIHPGRVYGNTDRRTDEAINSFVVEKGRITDWDEFRKCVVRFALRVETEVLQLMKTFETDVEYGWGLYSHILHKAFGPNGEKTAFEMARSGHQGGIYAVLKKVARTLAEKYARNEVGARVGRFWEGLTTEEKLEAGEEYVKKFGHLLPSELTEGSAARIRMNLPRVLEEHPRLMKRLGEVGRNR